MTKRTKRILALGIAIMMLLAVGLLAACFDTTSVEDTGNGPGNGPGNGGQVVDPNAPTGVTVAGGNLTFTLGEANLTAQLSATVAPATAPQTVVWSSANPTAVSVSETGLVTALAPATNVQVRATAAGTTHSGFILVTVHPAPVPVTGIEIVQTEVSIGERITQQLMITFAPTNPSNRNVTWSSANPAIATVSPAGLVTGVAMGNTTVTVTTEDGGHTATVPVEIRARLPGGIATYEEFQNMTLTGTYFLENDITFPEGFIFNPIGGGDSLGASAVTDMIAFRGTIDGRGHTVSNIYITAGFSGEVEPYIWQFGIFRRTAGATIRNIAFTGVSIYNRGGEGGLLIGNMSGNTVVENVFLSGTKIGWYWNNEPGYAWSRNAAITGPISGTGVLRNVVADVAVGGSNSRNVAHTVADTATLQNIYVVGDEITGFLALRHISSGSPTATNVNAFLMANIGAQNFSHLPEANWILQDGGLPMLRPLGLPAA